MQLIKSLSDKQLISFQESNAKINIWEGAVRSGKTYVSLVRFLDEVLSGPAGNFMIITRTYDTFRRNVLQILMELVGLDAKYYIGKRELNLWGKTIFVVGADDDRAEAKIRGPTVMGAYVDEATIIPETVFKQLVSRCAMGGARIFATTNPDSPFHWFKTEFIDNNLDSLSWQFTLDDNPMLTTDEKDYLRRQYQGIWYKRFIEGRWVQAEGAIYDFFEDSRHCIDFPDPVADYYIVGVDYGTTNPCAFTLLGVNRSSFPNMWVEKEYYYNSRVKQRQKTDSEYADDLRAFIAGKAIKAIYIDPSAASFKVELQRSGVMNLYDAKNDVLDGIRFVSDLLNNGTLKLTRCCQNLIAEMKSYVWDARAMKSGVDKPLKENDHALDSLRYAVFSHFFNKQTGQIDWNKIRQEEYGGAPELPRFFRDESRGQNWGI